LGMYTAHRGLFFDPNPNNNSGNNLCFSGSSFLISRTKAT